MKSLAIVQLVAKNGSLRIPLSAITPQAVKDYQLTEDSMLVYRYSAGDCDLIAWPKPNLNHLASTLFDARETGMVEDIRSVLLPNGQEFEF